MHSPKKSIDIIASSDHLDDNTKKRNRNEFLQSEEIDKMPDDVIIEADVKRSRVDDQCSFQFVAKPIPIDQISVVDDTSFSSLNSSMNFDKNDRHEKNRRLLIGKRRKLN